MNNAYFTALDAARYGFNRPVINLLKKNGAYSVRKIFMGVCIFLAVLCSVFLYFKISAIIRRKKHDEGSKPSNNQTEPNTIDQPINQPTTDINQINAEFKKAIEKNKTDKVKEYLEKGADVNIKDGDGITALIWASHNGHKEIVELLIEKGATVNAKSNKGWTALILAAYKGHKEIIELLIKNGADINAKNNDGLTALMVAKINCRFDIVRLLETFTKNGSDNFPKPSGTNTHNNSASRNVSEGTPRKRNIANSNRQSEPDEDASDNKPTSGRNIEL